MVSEFLKLFYEYSFCIIPTFLFALLISAILSETLPETFYERLGNQKAILLSTFLSSIVGALIPLCTCGMIPFANKLHNKGIPWLIVISFLTAGNASSITALFMTFVLGLKITLLRFIFAVIFGIIVSYIFVIFFTPQENISNQHSIEEHHKSSPIKERILSEFSKLLIGYGFWVLVAIFIASFISLYLKPSEITNFAGEKNLMSPFLLSLVGFPFYFCAGSDVPISKALLEKGAALGSVLAFMTASPGINLTSLLIYQKWLGLKNALVYLAISLLVCGLLGLAINCYYSAGSAVTWLLEPALYRTLGLTK